MTAWVCGPDNYLSQLPDSRLAAAIGRKARLELVFEARHGRTILAHSYAEAPFRIGAAFDLGGAAYVIIACSGPGIFGGDMLQQSIHVGNGARVVLTSQAALQVHPSATPLAAVICHEYSVAHQAELHCEWDPVIPFADARLQQRIVLASLLIPAIELRQQIELLDLRCGCKEFLGTRKQCLRYLTSDMSDLE